MRQTWNEELMDAILLAGGTPTGEDPLAEICQGNPKALLDVAGKPMAQWVLDAMDASSSIDRVIVAGLDADCGLQSKKITAFTGDKGGMLGNAKAGFAEAAKAGNKDDHVVIASSDIPTIRAEMIDWRVGIAMQTESDLDYAVVKREVMETRFPGSNRSFIHFRDAQVCGGDFNVARLAAIHDEALWDRLVAARKNALKQASMLGYDTLILLLLRRLTLQSAESIASKRLNLVGKLQISPYAEIAMDIDKLHQLEIARQDLSGRNEAGL